MSETGGRLQIQSEAPCISCVITSFNNGEDLRRAVESVLDQTLPAREIIIADDASSPHSREIAASLAARTPNTRLIARERNLGAGANRHLAILESAHPFITTLDGDDLYDRAKLSLEWAALEGRTDRIAYSDVTVTAPDGKSSLRTSKAFADLSPEQRLEATVLRAVPPPRDMLYAKDLYLASGGYDQSARMYEDWSLKMRLARQVKQWRGADAIGTIYRPRVDGLAAASRPAHAFWKVYALCRNLDWLVEALTSDVIVKAFQRVLQGHDDPELVLRAQRALERLPRSGDWRAALEPLRRLADREDLRLVSDAGLSALLSDVFDGLDDIAAGEPT